jgi:Lrp/AsnC family leucine-responsive transcriptional regulator
MKTKKPAPIELDATDRRLLNLLQDDCSLTNQALAKRVHLSAPTCLRRVKRLVDAGVIERQIAIVGDDKVIAGLTAVVEITLDEQAAERMNEFEKRVAGESAVQQCYRVSPGPDFVLVLHVADMAAYHELVHRLFTAEANVRNVRAFFSVQRSKFAPKVVM